MKISLNFQSLICFFLYIRFLCRRLGFVHFWKKKWMVFCRLGFCLIDFVLLLIYLANIIFPLIIDNLIWCIRKNISSLAIKLFRFRLKEKVNIIFNPLWQYTIQSPCLLLVTQKRFSSKITFQCRAEDNTLNKLKNTQIMRALLTKFKQFSDLMKVRPVLICFANYQNVYLLRFKENSVFPGIGRSDRLEF